MLHRSRLEFDHAQSSAKLEREDCSLGLQLKDLGQQAKVLEIIAVVITALSDKRVA